MAQTLRMNLPVAGKPAAAQPQRATKTAPRAATPTRAPAGTTRDVKAPITNVDRVTIEKVAGGYVVAGTKDSTGDWESEQAVATNVADRDALVTEMLGE